MRRRTLATMLGLLVVLTGGMGTPATAQISEPDQPAAEGEQTTSESPERDFERNHFGGLLGASRHLDLKDVAFTLGLDYTRRFSRRWALAFYVESVSSSIERDAIMAAAGVFYLTPHWSVLLGPGAEVVNRETIVNGQPEEEAALELVVRAGTGYVFPLTWNSGLGPAFFVDWTRERWTVVLGLAIVVGF